MAEKVKMFCPLCGVTATAAKMRLTKKTTCPKCGDEVFFKPIPKDQKAEAAAVAKKVASSVGAISSTVFGAVKSATAKVMPPPGSRERLPVSTPAPKQKIKPLKNPCAGCGEELYVGNQFCTACGAKNIDNYVEGNPGAMKHFLVCADCGTLGKGRWETPGLFIVELVLWSLVFLPGIIYSVWRLSARKKVCTSCGGKTIIPADSPRGSEMVARFKIKAP